MKNRYLTSVVYACLHMLLLMVCLPFTGKAGFPTKLFGNKSTTNSQIVRTWLFTAAGSMADGNAVVYGSQYSNAVDVWDAMKMTNPGENFGLLRQGFTLAVEARQPVSSDTMFFKMTNLGATNYSLKIVHEGMQAVTNATCILVDKFLNTQTPVSYNDTTYIAVPLTSDPASRAQNRLMLVYKPVGMVVVPVTFISFDVLNIKDKEAKLQWRVENETDINNYSVETSENGDQFYSIGSMLPTNNQLGAASYVFQQKIAAGPNHFYRIRANSKDGKEQLTKIIQLRTSEVAAGINIFPNPVANKTVQVNYTAATTGMRFLQVTDAFLKVVYQQRFSHAGAATKLQLPLQKNSPAGIYHLRITAEDGTSTQQRILLL
jgi:hypothetical protein